MSNFVKFERDVSCELLLIAIMIVKICCCFYQGFDT